MRKVNFPHTHETLASRAFPPLVLIVNLRRYLSLKEKEGPAGALERGVRRGLGLFIAQHFLQDLFERASRCYELDSTPEAVELWAAHLQQRFGGRPIAVILEQTRGPLVYMLTKYPHLVLFPVHPTTAARYRETFAPPGAKSGPSDTDSLLDLLLRHRERLRPLRPDTVEARLLHSWWRNGARQSMKRRARTFV
jgi:hypothetical protein